MESGTQITLPENRAYRRSWGRFAGIVTLFVVLGPLFGALGMMALLTAMAVGAELANGSGGQLASLAGGWILLGTLAGLPFAYSFGVVPAAVVGLAVAAGDRRGRGISRIIALVAAAIAWLIAATLAAGVVPPAGLPGWLGGLLVAHLMAVTLCTWAARRLFDGR